MKELNENTDISKYMPIFIDWATNTFLAIVIRMIGLWIANRVYNLVVCISKKCNKLDRTLSRFLGSVVRHIVLAFIFIAILNRFGVQTASIVALLGASGLAAGLALQGAMSIPATGVMLLIFRPYKVGDIIDAVGRFGTCQT